MAAVPFHFTTAGSAPVIPVRAGQSANLKGFAAINPSGTVMAYLKLWWYTPTTAVPAPVLGTTPPNLTIPINATSVVGAGTNQSWPDGITGNGELWVAVTAGTGLDTDTTATTGVVATLLVE